MELHYLPVLALRVCKEGVKLEFTGVGPGAVGLVSFEEVRGTHGAQRGVHVTQREPTAIYKPRRDPSGEGSPADTLVSDVWSPELCGKGSVLLLPPDVALTHCSPSKLTPSPGHTEVFWAALLKRPLN